MKEKKTKKMTKAEAFEYFKKKKILAKEKDANIGVQEKLFQCGIEWAGGGRVPFYHSDYLIVEESGHLYHCGCDDIYWFAHHYESISVDDILSTEIVEEKYELEFNYDKVVELAKPLMHYLNEVGCPDGIRVSQLGIVHEPMSTLIFDNGIGRIE